MAISGEPTHPIEKRDLLHGDPPDTARIGRIANGMAGAGRFPEAVDYLEITRDAALLARAEADAVERGSAWLLQQVERIRGTKCAPETWVRLSEAAVAAERHVDAVRALRIAGRDEDAEALRLAKCPHYDPFKPLGK